MSLVSLSRVINNDLASIERAILDSLNNIQYTFPKTIKNIVIKPNLCYYLDWSTGHTTDPKFVGALINFIRNHFSKDVTISIIESDASAMKCKYIWSFLGYDKLAAAQNVRLVNLAEETATPVTTSVNGKSISLFLPNIIKDADLRINVPKIKYMRQTGISCAMKNLYGCNPVPQKYKFHKQLEESIVALNKIMNFDLHILDGMIVSGVTPKKLNLVMASRDPVALDSVAASIAGLNPKKLKTLVLGQKEGVGKIDCITKGVNPASVAKEYPKPTISAKILTRAYITAVKMGLLSKNFL
ncbi:MAG: DUF362 domain-containing protein [Candidatus Bathyarchaeia archaeon]